MKIEEVRHRESDRELYSALGMEPLQEGNAIQKKEYRAGDRCPRCNQGRLDYDGLLNLSCAICGYALHGCFT